MLRAWCIGMYGFPIECQVELMVVVTVCFKLPNGSIVIVLVLAWLSIVYALDIIWLHHQRWSLVLNNMVCCIVVNLRNGSGHTVVGSLYWINSTTSLSWNGDCYYYVSRWQGKNFCKLKYRWLCLTVHYVCWWISFIVA